ncbi:transposase [Lactiplantibacillus pentosus]|uniref:helix-turn-helix domain-containing protein n=1 Tax=Lactiplantibacillus pentosus TaxID=1589 RepID=UPI000EAA61B5|nr:helix-turn-helix domain-containing protein [Lactiplantibacillus pentosus]AYG37376.1 transposase [Lactiplantibacillus pentosus]AYG40033.1 transposase [Lactiplantibacillus pentosus]
MIKYSSEFKSKVVNEYLDTDISFQALRLKYHIGGHSLVSDWVHSVQRQGLGSLKPKQRIPRHSQDFKLNVVNYIQTNEVSCRQAAQRFGVSRSCAYRWMRIYQEQGVAGLRPTLREGGPTLNKPENKPENHLTPTKEEQYQQEISELKHQLFEAKLDRDILKALAAITEKQRKQK